MQLMTTSEASASPIVVSSSAAAKPLEAAEAAKSGTTMSTIATPSASEGEAPAAAPLTSGSWVKTSVEPPSRSATATASKASLLRRH